ncbi:hypothetical protein Pse7367_2282 [Thalassoporum mexicanum PCC 7367]|uniref:MAPEG family protein n=1 Tax=Thalassoporum mexicanum TaxID=3457544 RepID=UPI00029FD2AE|nr:MAPEG family protein [Pseudanabaena sp. PCC 7367]AFY70545.1 hypothetical protein Pse7367_2282 [Pseudanabaena sp. PCC 7367]
MDIALPPSQILLYGIVAAAALIYLPAYAVVAYGRFQVGMDFGAPRSLFEKLPDYAKRATWAHQNCFECFALFVAAALMVYVSGHASAYTSWAVLVFLMARFAYSVFYILNVPVMRSMMWAIGMASIAGLMATSLWGNLL